MKNLPENSAEGFTLLELLIYLSLTAFIMAGLTLSTKSLIASYKKKELVLELSEALKTAINIARNSNQPIQIHFKELSEGSNAGLTLFVDQQQKYIIPINDRAIENINFKSGSVFKDHIQIDSKGFASPMSMIISYRDKSKSRITLSRMGAVSYTYEN